MPSRLGVGFILLFWLATTAHVVYHDVWPRLFSDTPPPVQIDLADEATQIVPTRWKVYRGDEQVGTLQTKTEYVAADDTFRFTNTFHKLKLDVVGTELDFPRLETSSRVNRAGELLEQNLSGEVRVSKRVGPVSLPLGDAAAEVRGQVVNGQLVGTCTLRYPANSPRPTVEKPLEAVPVPAGQVLNPMSPVSRLRDVRPGRRWVIREVNPLADSLAILFKDALKGSDLASSMLPQHSPGKELLAEVKPTPERLERAGREPVECWVIEYRGEEVQARTWVSRDDGRVLRQEAAGLGERFRFERDD